MVFEMATPISQPISNSTVISELLSNPVSQVIGLITLISFVFLFHRNFVNINNQINDKISKIKKKDFLSYIKTSFVENLTQRKKIMIFFSWASVVFVILLLAKVGIIIFNKSNEPMPIEFIFLSIAGIAGAFIFETSIDMEKFNRAINFKLEDIIKDKLILKSIRVLNNNWNSLDEEVKKVISDSIVNLALEKEEN